MDTNERIARIGFEINWAIIRFLFFRKFRLNDTELFVNRARAILGYRFMKCNF